MAFGVLEDAECPWPPGTTLLESVDTPDQSNSHLRSQVILSPQPSDSPNDPLKLSTARKELLFAVILMGSCFTGVIGPLLVPGFGVIATVFQITLTNVTLLNGALIMALGLSSYLCCALAVIYGKRLIYLLTTIILIVSCVWGAASQSYHSLLASRVFQGLGMGGFFALGGTASINDVFFIHQRGTRVGLWNFAVIVSTNITPVISGYVIVNLGWRWSFWLLVICFGILFVGIWFFFPETAFDRNTINQLSTTTSHIADGAETPIPLSSAEKLAEPTALEGQAITKSPDCDPAETHGWRRVMGIHNFTIKDQSQILRLCLAPVMLLKSPAVVWACAMWSVTFTWVIIIGAVASQIFAAPPYNLSTTQIGNLVGIAPLIGAALGTVSSGFLSDWLCKRLAVRNAGVYEPEFRLWILVPFAVTMAVGSFGLGLAVDRGLDSTICGVFLAILNFSVGCGCTGIISYLNDVCTTHPGEAFGLTMLIKSSFAFGLTFTFNNFYANQGPRVFFFTFGGLTLGVTAFTVPLYVYGKRLRGSSRFGIVA